MIECSREGCSRPATHAPKVCVPALGRGGIRSSAILTLVTCEPCGQALTSGDFLDPGDPGRENLRSLFRMDAAGRFMPDLDRAWIELVALTSAEFRACTPVARWQQGGRLQ